MRNDDNSYSPEAQGFSHSNPYDSRTYYTGRGHGHREHMPDNRGGYEAGDLETHWDYYNAAHYGSTPEHGRREYVQNYRSEGNPNEHYQREDYRYGSGNREWGLTKDVHENRNDRVYDRYEHQNRYADMRPGHDNHRHHRDVFEWVGSGVTHAWDRVTGHSTPDYDHRDRDRDYHNSYRNERRSYDINEENRRRYGNRFVQGWEKGHHFADDTPASQHHQTGHYSSNRGYNNRDAERDFWNPDGTQQRY